MDGDVIKQGREYRNKRVLHLRENEFDFGMLDLRCLGNPGANVQ